MPSSCVCVCVRVHVCVSAFLHVELRAVSVCVCVCTCICMYVWLQISMAMENRGRQLPAIAGNCHSTGNCRQFAPSDARSGWEFWTRVGEGFHASSESWVYVASKAHQKFQWDSEAQISNRVARILFVRSQKPLAAAPCTLGCTKTGVGNSRHFHFHFPAWH